MTNNIFINNKPKILKEGSFIILAAMLIVSGFFISNALALTSINVTSPNAGEYWGGTQDITWMADCEDSDTINIYYSTDDFISGTKIVHGLACDISSYSWNTVSMLDGANYKIKVRDSLDPDVGGVSGAFTIDNTDPVITVPDEQIFEAEGLETIPLLLVEATAIDNLDPSPVITYTPHDFSVGTTSITWTAIDAANNSITAVSNVVIEDTIEPVITLIDSNFVTLEYGSTYIDAGATASDIVDGDLTSSIVVNNPVNTSILGTYIVTYNVSDTALNSAIEVIRTVNVVELSITVTADAKSKVYGVADLDLTFQITNGTLVNDDSFSGDLTRDTNEDIGIYAIKQGTLALNSNYNLTYIGANLTINKAIATVSATADNKIYDGTIGATATLTVTGAVSNDTLTANYVDAFFANRNVDTEKTVNVTGITLGGDNAANYSFNQITTATADITPLAITVTAVTNTKGYDGNTSAIAIPTLPLGALAPNDIASFTEVYSDKSADAGKTLIPSGTVNDNNDGNNYAIIFINDTTGVITAKTLVVTATGQNKVYDATIGATVTLSDDRVQNDILVIGYDSANFVNENVGTGKAVSVSGISISGTDAGNYSLANATAATTANITQKPLSVTITVEDKVYDGTLSVTIETRASADIVGGDNITLSGGTAVFVDANVGNNKAVTATGIIVGGDDASNYSYDDTATGTGNILPIPMVVYVNDVFSSGDAGGHTFGYDAFATIQEGINAVDVGGIVNVADGTYDENLAINKGMILQGAGRSAVIITGTHTITANNVIIDGFTLDANGANFAVITIDDTAAIISGGTISGNKITNSNLDGIRIGMTGSGNGVDHITIQGNKITLNSRKGILFYNSGDYVIHSISYIIISGNEITNNGSSGISTYGPGPNTITDNTVSGNTGNGISIKYDDGDTVSGNIVRGNSAMGINMHEVTNTLVENNTVSGHLSGDVVTTFWGDSITAGKGSAIYVHEASQNNTISLNDLTGNKIGVLISREAAGDDPSGNSINNNEITSNTEYGILNALVSPSTPVDAQNNWWGNIEGPINAINNPHGAGDAVTDNVDFSPWCTDLDCNVIDVDAPTAELFNTPSDPTNADTANITVGGDGVVYYKYNLDNTSYSGETLVGTPITASNLTESSHIISVVGRDQAGNWQAEADATIYSWAVDTTPPVITPPADQTFEATGPVTSPTLIPATATDNLDPNPAITYAPQLFPVSTTTVTWTATDASGNSATAVSNVIITDFSKPIISVHVDITKEATSPDGAIVTYTNPTATDLVDGEVSVTCNPVSGSTFALISDITVNCSATDTANNTQTSSFVVSVVDTTAPIIEARVNVVKEATSASGAVVTYISPNSTDAVDRDVTATCSPLSGTTFALGTNLVNCNITDSHLNVAIQTSFNVIVEDTTAPVIDAHSDVTEEATSPDGAIVTYTAPNSTDAVDGDVTATCSPLSGTTFALGTNLVNCNITDSHGNAADQTSFDAIVEDTTPPEITNLIPLHISVTSDATPEISADFIESGSGINVSSIMIEINDEDKTDYAVKNIDGVNYTPIVPLSAGMHTVAVNVVDIAGNASIESSWSFIVNPTIASITVSSNKASLPADGTSQALIIAQVLDNGIPVEGAVVNFAAIIGTLSNITLSDINGRATAVLTSNEAGQTIVTASYNSNNGLIQGTINVSLTEVIMDMTPDPVTTYNIPLSAGWNLISLPLIPVSSAIEDVLAGISSNVDTVKYHDTSDGWLSYVPSPAGGTLTTMEDGKGYWIFMDVANTLIVNGVEMPGPEETLPTYPVISGWNLIGFKSVDSVKSSTYLSGISYITVYGYDESYFPVAQSASGGIDNDMNPGSGYWLYANAIGNIVP